jgi:hypothetical protein
MAGLATAAGWEQNVNTNSEAQLRVSVFGRLKLSTLVGNGSEKAGIWHAELGDLGIGGILVRNILRQLADHKFLKEVDGRRFANAD